MPLSLLQAAQMLGGNNYVELFDVVDVPMNGPQLFFHNAVAVGAATIRWLGTDYVPFPIEAEDFEANMNDQYPQPKLRVNNLDGIVYAMCLAYRDLLGATVRCHRLLFHTDAQGRIVDANGSPVVETPNANDPLPDPSEWLFEFIVNQRSNDSGPVVEFTLKAQPDTPRKVPAAFVSAHYCQWQYRGGGCPWANLSLLFDKNNAAIPWTNDRGAFDLTATYNVGDKTYLLINGVYNIYVLTSGTSKGLYPALATSQWTRDACSKTAANKTVTGCSCRFGQDAVLPADIYPATARLSAQ